MVSLWGFFMKGDGSKRAKQVDPAETVELIYYLPTYSPQAGRVRIKVGAKSDHR